MKIHKSWDTRSSRARRISAISGRQGPGSQAGAFIPKHWDILIKYCSHQTPVISSSLLRDMRCCDNWPDDLITRVMTCACPGLHLNWGRSWHQSHKGRMRFQFWQKHLVHQKKMTMQWTTHQNTDGGRPKCCFCRSIFIDDKNMTKCSIRGDLRQWGLGWGEKLSGHYKVISVETARDRPRSLEEKIQMRKTWE